MEFLISRVHGIVLKTFFVHLIVASIHCLVSFHLTELCQSSTKNRENKFINNPSNTYQVKNFTYSLAYQLWLDCKETWNFQKQIQKHESSFILIPVSVSHQRSEDSPILKIVEMESNLNLLQ